MMAALVDSRAILENTQIMDIALDFLDYMIDQNRHPTMH